MMTREQARAVLDKHFAGRAIFNGDLIVDAIMEASAGPEATPVAWRATHYDRKTDDAVAIQYCEQPLTYQYDTNHPYRIGDWQPLYAVLPRVSRLQRDLDAARAEVARLTAENEALQPRGPGAIVMEPRLPVAWRRVAARHYDNQTQHPGWVWSMDVNKPDTDGNWQPLYTE